MQPILLVYPHPDDEVFGSGGTTVRHAREGIPITYLCGTLGEMGRNMGRPLIAHRESLPKVREQELREACRILGISDLRLMGLRDKTVEFEDPAILASRIAGVIEEIRPTKLFTYYPGLGVHPDHDGMAWAAVRAVRSLPAAARPVLLCHPVGPKPEERIGPPDIVEDVSDLLEIKLEALRAHRSQSEVMWARLEQEWEKEPARREETMNHFRRERFWIYRVD